jgi:hypothetical protein
LPRPALLRVVLAEQVITAAERDDGLAGLAMQAVRGNLVVSELGHGRAPERRRENGSFRFPQALRAALPTVGRCANSAISRDLYRVGDKGLEPLTFRV